MLQIGTEGIMGVGWVAFGRGATSVSADTLWVVRMVRDMVWWLSGLAADWLL